MTPRKVSVLVVPLLRSTVTSCPSVPFAGPLIAHRLLNFVHVYFVAGPDRVNGAGTPFPVATFAGAERSTSGREIGAVDAIGGLTATS
jgi:hypothetical protein